MSDDKLTIWKYPILPQDTQVIEAPFGARFLTVQTQHDRPVIWALVNSNCPNVSHTVHVVGTGHNASRVAGLKYVGTFQVSGLVFHVFI